MIWARRLFLAGLILFCGGFALGFGFDDGGEETGAADAMTSIAVVMYLTSLVTFPITVLLFLAVLMPKPVRPGQGRSNRLVLGAIYALWLIVPLAVLVGVRSDSCMANGSCNEWGVANVVTALILALLPFPVWSLARRVAVRLTPDPQA